MKRYNAHIDRKNKFHNNNLYNNTIKQQIIDYIYETINIQKYKYTILRTEEDLSLLKKTKYYVSPNYNGSSCFLVFVKLKNKFYSVVLDKKNLSYNKNNFDINKVKILPIKIRLGKDLYDGTIFDGTLLHINKNSEQKRLFIINDVFIFCGMCLANNKLSDKIINIKSYLLMNSVDDSMINNISLVVTDVSELNKIRNFVQKDLKNVEYSDYIKGIIFLPEKSDVRLIYLYKNQHKDNIMVKHEVPQQKNKLKNDFVVVFKMVKTEIPDVYKLYLLERIKQDDKYVIKNKKVDIAYLPTKESSYFCKQMFEDTENSILVKCKYNIQKNKWIPFEKETVKKKPDKLKKIL